MITVAAWEENFLDRYAKEKRKIVVYGAGDGFAREKVLIPSIDMLCDKNADSIGKSCGIEVHRPEDMERIKEPFYILLCIMKETICEEVIDYLGTLKIEAVVFCMYNNIGLSHCFWGSPASYHCTTIKSPLKVHLVCSEPVWILHKFAIRLEEKLRELDVKVTLSNVTTPNADINHHIQFSSYHPYPQDTMMISHVDSGKLLKSLKWYIERTSLGICMSKETMQQLTMWGVPREKLCYINPAHDGVVKPRKYVIGITHKWHDDTRKRASAIVEIIDDIDPDYFEFIIMGSGWEDIILEIRNKGVDVKYYPEFDYDQYMEIVPTFDYLLYTGFDEGSMSYPDAVAAGVGTIVTPQGFHLDNNFPIDYPCRTIQDFKNAFSDLRKKKKDRVDSVREWTWENYAKKHLAIWNYLTRRKSLEELYSEQFRYEDGIYSMLIEDNRFTN